ncbi:MAG: hypothetical protein ACLTTQ_02345 [Christensenellales bacterium]
MIHSGRVARRVLGRVGIRDRAYGKFGCAAGAQSRTKSNTRAAFSDMRRQCTTQLDRDNC